MAKISAVTAAERLGITKARVIALISAGRLPAEKFANAYAIEDSDLALVADRKPGRPKKADDGEAAAEGKKAAENNAPVPTARLRKANANTTPAATPITTAEIKVGDALKELLSAAKPKKKKTRRSRRGGKGKSANKGATKKARG